MSWKYISVSGFTSELSVASAEEIKRRFPSLPLRILDEAFEEYLLMRGPLDSQTRHVTLKAHPTSSEMSSEIAAFLKSALDLDAMIESLTPAARHLIDESAVRDGRFAVLSRLSEILKEAAASAAVAGSRIPSGKRLHPRTALAVGLAQVVSDAGLEVNEKPKGPLVTLTNILLRDAEEEPSDTRKVVAAAIKVWKLRPSNSSEVSTQA